MMPEHSPQTLIELSETCWRRLQVARRIVYRNGRWHESDRAWPTSDFGASVIESEPGQDQAPGGCRIAPLGAGSGPERADLYSIQPWCPLARRRK